MPVNRKEGGNKDKKEKDGLGTTLLWVGGLIFAWAAVELAFKPLLKAGRGAIRKSLDPDYDVDDELDSSSRDNNNSAPSPIPPQPDDDNLEPKKSAGVDDPSR